MTLIGILGALSHPVHLSIVHQHGCGGRGASTFDCEVAHSTLSHHLKVLRLAGIIQHRFDVRQRILGTEMHNVKKRITTSMPPI